MEQILDAGADITAKQEAKRIRNWGIVGVIVGVLSIFFGGAGIEAGYIALSLYLIIAGLIVVAGGACAVSDSLYESL